MISNIEFYTNQTKIIQERFWSSQLFLLYFLLEFIYNIRNPAAIFFSYQEARYAWTGCHRNREGAGIPDDFWSYHNGTELALQYLYISKKSIYCLLKPLLFCCFLWAAKYNLYQYTWIQERSFIRIVKQNS